MNFEKAVANAINALNESEKTTSEREHVIYDEAYKFVEGMSFQNALLFLADQEGWSEKLFSELHSFMSDMTDYAKEQIMEKI